MIKLTVRCGQAILGTCDNMDCKHYPGHLYDDESCNPRFCKVQGIPSRCIEEVGLCKQETGTLIDEETVLVQEGD